MLCFLYNKPYNYLLFLDDEEDDVEDDDDEWDD